MSRAISIWRKAATIAVEAGAEDERSHHLSATGRQRAIRDLGIELLRRLLCPLLEVRQGLRDKCGGNARRRAYGHLVAVRFGVVGVSVSDLPGVVRHRQRDLVVDATMPVLGHRDGGIGALFRLAGDGPENIGNLFRTSSVCS